MREATPWRVSRPTAEQLPDLVAVSLAAAQARARLDGRLWAIGPDAQQRIATVVQAELSRADGPVDWRIVAHQGRVVGAARFAVIPAPPVYDLRGGKAGIVLDDTHVTADAPAQALDRLLDEVEQAARQRGAVVLIAACAHADEARRERLGRRGHAPLTQYRVRHELSEHTPPAVRPAQAGDLPALVAFNQQSQDQREAWNAHFWRRHAEAPTRFRAWMEHSLQAPERRVLVHGPVEAPQGFIVAQAVGLPHLPLACQAAQIGLVDDFHCAALATSQHDEVPHAGDAAALELLRAAEASFHAQGRRSSLVICADADVRKLRVLDAAGYGPGNLWLIRT